MAKWLYIKNFSQKTLLATTLALFVPPKYSPCLNKTPKFTNSKQ
ncbi:hypothetical protein HPCPY1962_0768 [Helicobacter pylori CPY1962]|nr:hypothetical protein HPCPY1962_0768 [Helicobacter pylori CPY1962]